MALDTSCNCLAVRQAARHITQFYDQCLAPTGLRTTQYSILVNLERIGPSTINLLAGALVMDRTTLGRTMLPLQRDGLISVGNSDTDGREKVLRLTRRGKERLRSARRLWTDAQLRFEAAFGGDRASRLRDELRALVASDLPLLSPPEVAKRTRARVRPPSAAQRV